jgi:hypothetical protein
VKWSERLGGLVERSITGVVFATELNGSRLLVVVARRCRPAALIAGLPNRRAYAAICTH